MGWKSKVARTSAGAVAPFVSGLGRIARNRAGLAPPTSRDAFLRSIGQTGGVLEIGPFYCPQLKGAEVRYFDVLDQAQLQARAGELGWDPGSCPVIHFVSPTGDLSVIDRQFGAVFSSHCIEHQPDMVMHLQQVERLLQPGGCYHLIIPDKRYCFDHFLPESHLGELCEAHLERRTYHTAGSVMSHRLMLSHNNSILHWMGIHGRRPSYGGEAVSKAIEESTRSLSGEYVDVHAWCFTPRSFRSLVVQLGSLGLTKLQVERVHDTGFGEQEFFAVLKKPLS